MQNSIDLNSEQQAMLDGKRGIAKQMGMRLLLDMAAAAGAEKLVPRLKTQTGVAYRDRWSH